MRPLILVLLPPSINRVFYLKNVAGLRLCFLHSSDILISVSMNSDTMRILSLGVNLLLFIVLQAS